MMRLIKCPNCGNAVLLINSNSVSHVKCISCGYEQRLSDCIANDSEQQDNTSSSSIEGLIPIMGERIKQYEKKPSEILAAAIEFGIDCNVLIEILNIIKRVGSNNVEETDSRYFVTLESGSVSVDDINTRLDSLEEHIKSIPQPVLGLIHSQTNDAVMALNKEIDKLKENKALIESQISKVVAELQKVKERLSKYEIIC